jgi:endonuclease YncB( thermonuclease family)
MHAFFIDEGSNETYLDDYPVPADTSVFWTAYERHRIDGEDQPNTWVFDKGDYDACGFAARAKADELGIELRIEHDPEDIYE